MTTKKKKVFFLYAVLVAILIITGYSLRYIYDERAGYYIVVRIYNVVEFCLLSYFFSLFIKNKIVKNTLLLSIPLYTIFCVYDFLNEKTPGLPFIPASIEYIVLLLFIIYFFFEVMQETVAEPIYQKAIFWISVAFIINFSGNFFLFLYSKSSYNNEDFKTQYTIIYTTVTVIKNLLLCIAISIKEKTENPIHANFSDIDLDAFYPIKDKT